MRLIRLFFVVLLAMIVVTFRRLLRGPLHRAWRWRKELIAHVLREEGRRQLYNPAMIKRLGRIEAPIPPEIAEEIASVEPDLLEDVPVEITTPRGWQEGGTTILYMHGGGYISCSPGTHRDMVARIAVAATARCVSVDYRLAPEHPFPSAVDDGVAAYMHLLEGGSPASRIVIAGDSAGGGLTVATLLRLKAAGDPLPAAGILISPWVDLECTGESIEVNAKYDYIDRQFLEHCAGQYLQEHDPRDPLASPVHADLSGLPPLMVLAGGAETLLSEIRLLAERAREAGVEVNLRVGEAMFHVWPAFATFLPEGLPDIKRIGEFVRSRVVGR
jgi:acetyl esterase/lipase